MFNILILLLLGIASGYVFRNSGFLKNIDKSVSATVLFMLFVFGIEALLKKGVLQVVIPNKIFYNTIVQLNEE